MKLYATITSERATMTGKGGNKYIVIELTAGNANTKVATVTLERDDVMRGYGLLVRINSEYTDDSAGRTVFFSDDKITGKR